MQIGRYRINFDALLARIVYRWHFQAIGAVVLLIACIGFASGLLPPFWQGRAALAVVAAPGATVQLDGWRWPRAVYAGQHTVRAVLPDGRASWATFTLQAGQALILTLPAGLPEPREREVPLAAPGTQIDHIWWADGAWRVRSVQAPLPDPQAPQPRDAAPTPAPQPGRTIAISRSYVDRLTTLDAYAGLADQLQHEGQRIEAVYRLDQERGAPDQALGSITVRGWASAPQIIPIAGSLTLLRLAPDGQALLIAERVPGGGEQAYLIRPGQPRVPLVAVPGQIVRLSWRPDSRAVVVHSLAGTRLTLTLVRLVPSIHTAVVAELDAARFAGAIVPLIWDDAGLLWVAPDQSDTGTFLWAAPLTSLIPERRGALDARALTRLPDGTLRVLCIQDGAVVIGRVVNDSFIGETQVPRVPAAPDLAGIWQGDELFLQGDRRAWLLDVREGT